MSSATFEATAAFAAAKAGGGSNVHCNDLLGGDAPPTLLLNAVRLVFIDTSRL
ncbi:MAG: hypothetical protein H6662_16940 [Ardenticatenaceae bacterium]|nr:hypothetical protein [Ardenticatenaceae bacterium]